ncbi:hypothetical protein B0O99DRAFT_600895 [Bisporella sp. PMI_857]|nr:hypothetical protein B0O99DRAFT_600895 [Bisporella sp. PMI_857]
MLGISERMERIEFTSMDPIFAIDNGDGHMVSPTSRNLEQRQKILASSSLMPMARPDEYREQPQTHTSGTPMPVARGDEYRRLLQAYTSEDAETLPGRSLLAQREQKNEKRWLIIKVTIKSLSLLLVGLIALISYTTQKHDLGTGMGICALIWTAGVAVHRIFGSPLVFDSIIHALPAFIVGVALLLLFAIWVNDLATGTGLCAMIWTVAGGAQWFYRTVIRENPVESQQRDETGYDGPAGVRLIDTLNIAESYMSPEPVVSPWEEQRRVLHDVLR